MTCCTTGCNANSRRIGTMLLVFVVAMLAFQFFSKSKAAMPPAFASGTTFNEAVETSATDGKVVLVLAHADWCGPCQNLKRGALADPQVTQWLEANAHAVSLDVTKMDDSTPQWVKEAADSLDISGIPAMVLLRDGKIISKSVGSISADRMLEWLKEFGTPSPASSMPS